METKTIMARKIPVALWKRFIDRCNKKGLLVRAALVEALSEWLKEN